MHWMKQGCIGLMSPRCPMQAAQAIGDLARENQLNPEYESPYAAEARKAGHDLGWWEKISQGRITGEGFKLAQLTVRSNCLMLAFQPSQVPQACTKPSQGLIRRVGMIETYMSNTDCESGSTKHHFPSSFSIIDFHQSMCRPKTIDGW